MNNITMPELVEVESRLKAKRAELAKTFAEATNDAGELDASKVDGFKDGNDLAEYARKMNAELDELGAKAEGLRQVLRAAGQAEADTEKGESEGGRKSDRPLSLGEMLKASGALERKNQSTLLDVEVKTLFQTSAGWDPEVTRSGRVVDSAVSPVDMLDLVPTDTTTQAGYKYMEETTFTSNAAEVAEGGTYGESAFALTERLSPVEKVAVFIPVTDEQLEDEPQAGGYLERRLTFQLRRRLGSQLLVGNGTAPNLRGIGNTSGIQTQAKGTDPTPDAVYKAMTKIEVTGQAMATAVVMHPNDWQDVRLLRTSDGVYVWGPPSDAGPARIWGVPVVKAQSQTQNTALVGDFANYCGLFIRRGIEVQVSNSHADFFVNGKQAMRADMRAAFVVFRPAAFATVTGI